jgi:hypothetical protein
MSEYQFVEKPLLIQLASMGWQVNDRVYACLTEHYQKWMM